ncbi:hypothetical protein CC86DRAFT_411572 [Ophiobolus disseminans]|uniref:Uncharacterized protein n=1 Tax=Ophiobolus disseminans TaxID=1469910 RepID=A0A6A6ZLR4_9PLEO|nr:hypothetical protein CC86DRAFT_411572 [Ophiobolus disseminans]
MSTSTVDNTSEDISTHVFMNNEGSDSMPSEVAFEKIRKSTSALFSKAPPRTLEFPQDIEITACEILAFLPNWIRCHDVVFRFASNGVANQIVATIVNYFRRPDDKGDVDANSMCKIMGHTMCVTGYQYPGVEVVNGVKKPRPHPWTNTRHKKHGTKDTLGSPWSHQDLTFAGKSPDLHGSETLVGNVRFDSLADGLQRWPSVQRGDGLRLTGCVQYAVAHPEENLMFPCDFKALAEKLILNTTRDCHLDGATFKRWGHRKTPSPPGPLIVDPNQVAAAQAQSFSIPQPQVRKPYKSSKASIQDALVSSKKVKRLSNLSDQQQHDMEIMMNKFQVPYSSGAVLPRLQGSGGLHLVWSYRPAGRQASAAPPSPSRFSLKPRKIRRPASPQQDAVVEDGSAAHPVQPDHPQVVEVVQVENFQGPDVGDLSSEYQAQDFSPVHFVQPPLSDIVEDAQVEHFQSPVISNLSDRNDVDNDLSAGFVQFFFREVMEDVQVQQFEDSEISNFSTQYGAEDNSSTGPVQPYLPEFVQGAQAQFFEDPVTSNSSVWYAANEKFHAGQANNFGTPDSWLSSTTAPEPLSMLDPADLAPWMMIPGYTNPTLRNVDGFANLSPQMYGGDEFQDPLPEEFGQFLASLDTSFELPADYMPGNYMY